MADSLFAHASDAQQMESQKFQWERRYQDFLRQKKLIMNANLSDQQKQQQVETLLRRHYTEQEIETARAYDRENGR